MLAITSANHSTKENHQYIQVHNGQKYDYSYKRLSQLLKLEMCQHELMNLNNFTSNNGPKY